MMTHVAVCECGDKMYSGRDDERSGSFVKCGQCYRLVAWERLDEYKQRRRSDLSEELRCLCLLPVPVGRESVMDEVVELCSLVDAYRAVADQDRYELFRDRVLFRIHQLSQGYYS